MNQSKGVNITFLLEWLKEFDLETQQLFFQSLSEEDCHFIKRLHSTDWISDTFIEHIWSCFICRVLRQSSDEGLHTLGYVQAKKELTGIYRFVLSITSIAFLINQSAKLWRLHHGDGLSHVSGDAAARRLTFTVENYPDLVRSIRLSTSGYIQGSMEISGAKNVSVMHLDRDPMCWQWDIGWD